MAKLTKKQKQKLEMALSAIDRLINFIDSDRIAFCHVEEINQKVAQGPNDFRARDSHRSQHYVGRDNYEWDIDYIKQLKIMDKGIGSDLVSRYTARKILQDLLNEE
jgi:hypothetical protein